MIRLDIEGHVASVTLERAPVNAINETWIARMDKVLDQLQAHGHISVIHIRSALKVFCAGVDLDLMQGLLETPEGRDAMVDFVREIQRVFLRLENTPVVTLAEIGGAALGGGLELALACDLRVAADTAKLGLPEASLGLLPGAGGTQRLSRICGEAVASRLILGAEVIDGREAERLGLVQWCIPAAELPDWTRELAQREGSLPEHALAAAKTCIAASHDDAVDGFECELQQTRKLQDIAETQERIRSFLDKAT